MKKKLSFIAVLFTILSVMCVSAYAANNTVKTAKTITENNTISIKFNKDTNGYYLKFIPSKSAYYEIDLANFVSDNTYITVYNKYGNDLDYGKTNEFTNRCMCAREFEANETYYFLINCYTSKSITVKATVKKHVHTIVKEYTKKASYGIGGVGIRDDSCAYCDYRNNVIISSITTIKLSKAKYTYNGKVVTPTVIVKDSGEKVLKNNRDYTVKYSSGRKNPGKYAVKITFKGDYTGKETLYFTITPATPSLSVTAGTKKAVLKWNKQVGATGYVVYMSTSKDGKYTRIATVKGNSSVNYTKTGLTKGKTYYFKVAAYKTVGSTNIYSSFSAVRYVKIK